MSIVYRIGGAVALLWLLSWPAAPAGAAELTPEFLAGYPGGLGGQMGFTLSHFMEHSAISLRLAAGYATMAPGDAIMAREVFVNENDNGTPEKAGHDYSWRLDLLAPISRQNASGWSIYGGPRYSRFTANFRYVGGNEEFDVRDHQWGVGGGMDFTSAMSPLVNLRLSGGADYFFKGTMEGHDSEYSPDNDNVNPKDNYSYQDAEQAINQPGIQFRAMIGIQLRPHGH